jgi:phytoene synthase
LALAERFYESGDAGMRFLPPRARWAIVVASRLYRAIGRRLRRRHQSNPFGGRVVVPWFAKIGLVAGATFSWVRLSLFPSRTQSAVANRDYLGTGTGTGAGTGTGTAPATVVMPSGHGLGHTH